MTIFIFYSIYIYIYIYIYYIVIFVYKGTFILKLFLTLSFLLSQLIINYVRTKLMVHYVEVYMQFWSCLIEANLF